jgi:glycosyltransferase involved in cell wall biosynthesis
LNIVLCHSGSPEAGQSHPRLSHYFNALVNAGENPVISSLSHYERPSLFGKLIGLVELIFDGIFGKKKADIYYIYSSNILFLPIYILSKLIGAKLIIEKTELDSTRPDKGLKDYLVNLAFWLDEKILHVFVDKMVVISPLIRDVYKKNVERIHITPAFTDTKLAKWEPAENLLRIGYLGSFGSKDNVEGIIAAFLLARKKLPDLKLKLMGDAPASMQHKHRDSIEFTGFIESKEFFPNLYECDLLISNRSDTTYASYGSPTKLVEYLATGIPVISTQIGSMSESLKDGEHLRFVNADDPSLLAACMVDRYTNPKNYSFMGLAGRELCRKEMDVQVVLPAWKETVLDWT